MPKLKKKIKMKSREDKFNFKLINDCKRSSKA